MKLQQMNSILINRLIIYLINYKLFMARESCSAVTVHDLRGFATKMYTQEGLILFTCKNNL